MWLSLERRRFVTRFARDKLISPIICPPLTYTKFLLRLFNSSESIAFIAIFKHHMLESGASLLLHNWRKFDDLLSPNSSFWWSGWESLRYGHCHMILLSVNTSSFNCYVLMLRGLKHELWFLRGVVTSSYDVLVLVACERTLLEVAICSRLRLHPLTSPAVYTIHKWPI